MAELLYRLGQFSVRRPWRVIITWLVILALSAGGYLMGAGTLATNFDIPDTPSSRVVDELAEKLPDFAGASGTVVFHTTDGTPMNESQRTAISDLVAEAQDLEPLATVVDPFEVEADRHASDAELADALAQIEAGRAELEAGQKQLNEGRAELEAAQAQIDVGYQLAEEYGLDTSDFPAHQAQIDAGFEELNKQQAVIDDARTELETNAEMVNQGKVLQDNAADLQMVSDDESAALVNVIFTEPRLELTPESQATVIDHFSDTSIEGVQVDFSSDIAQGIPKILGIGEAVGVAIAGVVLIVMLGTAIAAAFPIVTALVGVGVGVMAALALSGVIQMTSVTPVLGVMLGLAVGIDYSLFIVNRHRKQLLQGVDTEESVGLANGTAGNAVVFAGATVVIALLALNVTGVPFLGLMGTVAAFCVAVAVLVGITLTPALLGLAGERILSAKAREQAEQARVEHERHEANNGDGAPAPNGNSTVEPMSTARAWFTTVIAIGVLLVLAIPALSMRLGLPDGSSEPEDSTSYAAYAVTAENFGEGVNGPVLVTANMKQSVADDDLVATQADIVSDISRLSAVVAVAPAGVSDDSKMLAFQVVPREGPNSESTENLIHSLRLMGTSDDVESLGVAGQAAMNIDISEGLQDALPLYLSVVVGLSLLIMIVVFRSILVPAIATGGFVLSLLASFGAVVAVFQWGWLADLLDISTGPILSFFPILLVGILFGLAMDYQLFLATGMREAYVLGSPARIAVIQGWRTGRAVVIAAGLIMVSVFGGFIFAESSIVRLMGFGLAFGVAVDAFIVRLLLMPALMHLHGSAAWRLPAWLDKILPNIDVEGAVLERRHSIH